MFQSGSDLLSGLHANSCTLGKIKLPQLPDEILKTSYFCTSLSFSGRWQLAPAALLSTFSAVFPLPHPPFFPPASALQEMKHLHTPESVSQRALREIRGIRRGWRERREMLLLPLQRRAVLEGGAEGSILPYWVQRTLAAVN